MNFDIREILSRNILADIQKEEDEKLFAAINMMITCEFRDLYGDCLKKLTDPKIVKKIKRMLESRKKGQS